MTNNTTNIRSFERLLVPPSVLSSVLSSLCFSDVIAFAGKTHSASRCCCRNLRVFPAALRRLAAIFCHIRNICNISD